MKQVLDKEKLTKELNAWMEKIGKPKDSKLPLVNLIDEYDFEIELKKGIVTQGIFQTCCRNRKYKKYRNNELTKLDQ